MSSGNPSNKLFKSARIFDPRQAPTLPNDLADYVDSIKGLNVSDPEMLDEWAIYMNMVKEPVPEDFNIVDYWRRIRQSNRIPKLTEVALPIVMMPVSSVDVERSFSMTGQILSPQRHNLSEENFKGLAALYYNSGIL